jgi:prolyl-tRNA editing enzyme YbaK/EbsC (Cys-tRNA(Pro) deacylase)
MEADLPSGARAATAAGLDFDLVRTERPSSAEESARLQGIRLEQLLRTIVVRRGEGDYVFVLVPGGRQIDWPKLRAHLATRRISLPDRDEAREATGYERGTITPFGSSTAWPVIADAGIRSVDRVAIGAGAHGGQPPRCRRRSDPDARSERGGRHEARRRVSLSTAAAATG